MESRTDFFLPISGPNYQVSDPIDAHLTADFTKSTLLCARSQEADVTGNVSRKTAKA